MFHVHKLVNIHEITISNGVKTRIKIHPDMISANDESALIDKGIDFGRKIQNAILFQRSEMVILVSYSFLQYSPQVVPTFA